MRILIGSPIKQQSSILKEFLLGLEEADKGGNRADYFFVDDNTEEASSELLCTFAQRNCTVLKKGTELFSLPSEMEENNYQGHNWKAVNLAKVTAYKNAIIQHCIDDGYDYLFLIDSDIVIDKRTIPQLIGDNVDIVSNVFWNQWVKNGMLTPQCFWIPDIYKQDKEFNVPMTFEEAHQIRMGTIEKMKLPGLYSVDGLGACTLVKREALEKGVNFTEIPNLKIPGEDRPFCIRAGVAGYTLYMDTHYPAYHISKAAYLNRVDEYKKEGWKFDMCQIFEEEVKHKKRFPRVRKLLVRIGRKIVRDLSD